MTRFSIPSQGGHLSVLAFGRAHGPIDLVFLHATGFCAQVYRHLLERLGPERRVLALDLRGHGHSTLPAHPSRLTGWDVHARDVSAALRALRRDGDLPPPRLIAGHSMGGASALLALGRDSEVAQALLLIDPALIPRVVTGVMRLPFAPRLMRRCIPIARAAGRRRADFPDRAAALQSYRGRGAFKTWLPGFLEDYVEGGFMQRADGHGVTLRCTPAWEAATFSAHRHDLHAALRSLRVPARMLVAEHGSIAMREPRAVKASAPTLEIETVPGTTHFIPMEVPGLVIERMTAMMDRLGLPKVHP
jgi:pimeloyl-ACP methyl ester carboxylesterase